MQVHYPIVWFPMLHISPFSGQQTSHILDFTPLLSSVKLWDCRWFCVMVLVPFYSIVPVVYYALSSSVSVQFQISEPRATATGDVIYFLKYSLATNNMERESVILLTSPVWNFLHDPSSPFIPTIRREFQSKTYRKTFRNKHCVDMRSWGSANHQAKGEHAGTQK